MRLAIGAAQMGMPYGVANRSGQVQAGEAARMIALAKHRGVDTIDTAAAYGGSERTLGSCDLAGMRVVTKIPALPDGCTDPSGWVERSVQESCERLRVSELHAVLVHRAADLLGPAGPSIVDTLERMRHGGCMRRVGVSVYDPDELASVAERMRLEVVQLPRSPMDRRFERAGWIDRLHRSGTEIHVRSILLQGLLAIPRPMIPGRFDRWSGHLAAWHAWLADERIGALEACLADALAETRIDRIILGFDGLAQLEQACELALRPPRRSPEVFAVDDLDLLLPSRWSAE